MKNICQFNDIESRLDDMWNRAEAIVVRFFIQLEAKSPEGEVSFQASSTANEMLPLPKMTEFNVIVAAIKRIQEGRFALLKERMNREPDEGAAGSDPQRLQEEISGILEALERNGGGQNADQDEMPD